MPERRPALSQLLPSLAGELLRRLPQYPPSLAAALFVNAFFDHAFAGEERTALRGKTLRIRVLDAGLTLSFALGQSGFRPRASSAPAAVTISANTADFLQLARGTVDPDTLFFSRRLCVEGDTDLGLLLKNTFERSDWRERLEQRLGPAGALVRLLQP